MEISVQIEKEGTWCGSVWDDNKVVYFNSHFPSYAKAELDAKARLSELERIVATGG